MNGHESMWDVPGRSLNISKEEDERLCATFPSLYSDRHGDMSNTAMCWGFEIGRGWHDIVWRLSEKLESLIQAQPPEHRSSFKALQVKEKMGVLRFYMTASTDEMDRAIDAAEEESLQTCEICGAPGKIEMLNRWLTTTCAVCYKKMEEGRIWTT